MARGSRGTGSWRWQTRVVRRWTVAGGVIEGPSGVLLVQNRRKNGSLDWSTPGGVVDPGEQVLEALQREVVEETALTVAQWSPLLYTVDVDFVGRDLTLHAEVYRAIGYAGELAVDDPDRVVVDGRWVDHTEARDLLDESPAWVAQPLRHALEDLLAGPGAAHRAARDPVRWRYDVVGERRGFTARLLEGPGA